MEPVVIPKSLRNTCDIFRNKYGIIDKGVVKKDGPIYRVVLPPDIQFEEPNKNVLRFLDTNISNDMLDGIVMLTWLRAFNYRNSGSDDATASHEKMNKLAKKISDTGIIGAREYVTEGTISKDSYTSNTKGWIGASNEYIVTGVQSIECMVDELSNASNLNKAIVCNSEILQNATSSKIDVLNSSLRAVVDSITFMYEKPRTATKKLSHTRRSDTCSELPVVYKVRLTADSLFQNVDMFFEWHCNGVIITHEKVIFNAKELPDSEHDTIYAKRRIFFDLFDKEQKRMSNIVNYTLGRKKSIYAQSTLTLNPPFTSEDCGTY